MAGQRIRERYRSVRSSALIATLVLGVGAVTQARANEAPPEAAPVAPAAAPAPTTAAPAPAIPAAPETKTPIPVAEAAPPPPPPPKPELVHMGVAVRAGLRFQGVKDQSKLNDQSIDTADINPRFNGSLHKYINWSASLYAVAQSTPGAIPPTGGTITLLDLIAQFDLHDYFHLWLGRMLVPSDRSNFSGPYFMSAWNYPGIYAVPGKGFAVVAPKSDYLGRSVGGTAWGQFGEGLVKYYLGTYQLDQPGVSPLFSGRINVSLLNPEPGYYNGSTYYGTKNIVAIGVGAQAQSNGSARPVVDPVTGTVTGMETKNFYELNADVLAEYNVGGGTLTGEAAFYKFSGFAPVAPVDYSYFVLGSYMLPFDVGGGRFQPLLRYQATKNPGMNITDAFVSYVLRGPFLRIHAGYQRTDMGMGIVGNAIQMGVQIQQL